MENSDTRRTGETILYRIVIGGPMATDWADWFGAVRVAPSGENSVLEVEVADQAELYGRLRRIHDLHLPLISIQVIDPSPPREEASPGADPTKPIGSNPNE